MIKRYGIENSKVVPRDGEDGPILVYVSPTEDERKGLVERLGIDEHTLASSLDADELSRLEFEPNHIAIIFKRPKNYSGTDQLLFKVESTGLFLFRDRIVLVLSEDIPLFDGKPFARIGSLRDLALRLIYRSIFHFLEHLRIINFLSDELERRINAAMENRFLINLFTLEKSLVYYLNSINANQVLIEKLKLSAGKIELTTEEAEFLDDMAIENNQCYRQAEIYSNILASLMDARASIVGNNLNVLMKTLNVITIGIMIPTFVVSAFSMNVGIPLQKHPYAFWFILLLALLSMGGVVVTWRKLKW